MTMHINHSPEMAPFTKGNVLGRFYGNATEVIRDALRRMQAEEAHTQAWRVAIQQGDTELDHGEGIAYTAKSLDDITDAAIRDLHSGIYAPGATLPAIVCVCRSRIGPGNSSRWCRP